MRQAILIQAMAAVLATHAMADDANDVTIQVTPDGLIATSADGIPVWRARGSEASMAGGGSVDARGFAVGDLLLSDDGSLLARKHSGGGVVPMGVGGEGDCPSWDSLTQVTPPPPTGTSDSFAPLLVDRQHNIWVVNTHVAGDYALQVRRSIGHGGAWMPIETISDTTKFVSQPEGTIDADGNVTIVFRDIDGGYHLYSIRHELATGWGPLTLAYSSATFFQAIEVAADEDGDVIAILDPGLNSTSVWTDVYEASTDTWGQPEQVSPVGYNILLPTIARNRSGSAVYLV